MPGSVINDKRAILVLVISQVSLFALYQSNVFGRTSISTHVIRLNGQVHTGAGALCRERPDITQSISVAIGMGLTTKKFEDLATRMETDFSFFKSLLPSFCETASLGFAYHFFIAYDINDPGLTQPSIRDAFQSIFFNVTETTCPNQSTYALRMIQCSHSRSPAWAQNDAMIEAYLSDMEYFYRINDDTIMTTSGWTEKFIEALADYTPANVGVVGPDHSGGNTKILTYDFVHRTHIELFGFYYPRLFPDLYADVWIDYVYQPGRTTKLKEVGLTHTMEKGQRYKMHGLKPEVIMGQVAVDRETLGRYLSFRKQLDVGLAPKINGRVIAMSLDGLDPVITWGAVRNAQIAPIFFPQWELRFYLRQGPHVERPPERVIAKLASLGATIVEIPESVAAILPWTTWSYLVIDDASVTHFLLRSPDQRLSDRDASAVESWMETDWDVHCLRDHPRHVKSALWNGLWGGRTPQLHMHANAPIQEMLSTYFHDTGKDNQTQKSIDDFLKRIMWPLVSAHALCHDSVSCDTRNGSVPFPTKRPVGRFLGQTFMQHEQVASKDELWSVAGHKSCAGRNDITQPISVAIGMWLTSRNFADLAAKMKTEIPFFKSLLPSFCETASLGFAYHFFIAYDRKCYNQSQPSIMDVFQSIFFNVTETTCPNQSTYALHMIQCSHSRRPAWAQNDAMIEAYLSDMEYFYRINDDTIMTTSGWTEKFIEALADYTPANVGVVGPDHSAGNTKVPTYDFVHRTHIELFGFYYPRLFADLYADRWITDVYQPGRSSKLKEVGLTHTMEKGQRYKMHDLKPKVIEGQVAVDRETLGRYLSFRKQLYAGLAPKINGRVIAMSLDGLDPVITWGAVRNAQIAPIFFPQWELRFYLRQGPHVERPPERVIAKLASLGATIVEIPESVAAILPWTTWSYLVIDDATVTHFLLRSPDQRLSDRDASAVKSWMGTDWDVHCLRDHPRHVKSPLWNGLWGGRKPALRMRANAPIQEMLSTYFHDTKKGKRTKKSIDDFLKRIMWPLVSAHALCHDSVSCDKRNGSVPFPTKRPVGRFLGQTFTQHEQVASKQDLRSVASRPACAGRKN